MGIRGARSLLDGDPVRYSEIFRVNWETEDSADAPLRTLSTIFLVDAMALLYFVVVKTEGEGHAYPRTVRNRVSAYVSKLVQVVSDCGGGRGQAVHIFLDALAPREKMPTRRDRLTQQAVSGDILAQGVTSSHTARLLHLLAEWSLVEAIEDLMQRSEFRDHLFLHRATKGEAEPYIDRWLKDHPVMCADPCIQIAILSDDSDFLVYPSCPGFIPFSSIKFEEQNGQLCLQGRHYLRSKFIRAFLPRGTADTIVMTTVAMLAGCDYILNNDLEDSLKTLRKLIIESDIGGLRQKVRNNPSAASALTAILRTVTHHVQKAESRRENWSDSLASTLPPARREHLLAAIASVHRIYLNTLQLSEEPRPEINPGSVDARRLLEEGLVYCTPVVETWTAKKEYKLTTGRRDASRKRVLDDRPRISSTGYCDGEATSPPSTRQIFTYMGSDTVWAMPHFCQIRMRLYFVIQLALCGGPTNGSHLAHDSRWTGKLPFVMEIMRRGTGRSIQIVERLIDIPAFVSTGGMNIKDFLKQENGRIDRSLLFCILGDHNRVRSVGTKKQHGTLFLASLMLPVNLACLLILLGTAPSFNRLNLPRVSREPCQELNRVLSLVSVACYHAILLVNTVSKLCGTSRNGDDGAEPGTSEESAVFLSSFEFVVSETICHDNALLIWKVLCLDLRGWETSSRLNDLGGSNAGLQSIHKYLDDAFDRLDQLATDNSTTMWKNTATSWKDSATPLWLAWWETFKEKDAEKIMPL
jgi:hypothetical protein